VPKGKKIQVLTHRPRYIETTRVPKLGEVTSSTADPRYLTIAGSKGELAEVSEVIGQEKTKSAGVPKHPTEAKEKAAEEPELGESAGLRKILSPPPEPELPKVPRAPVITPKRRRMASVLGAVLESTRASTPAPAKETVEAATARAEAEARPSVRIETDPVGTGQCIEQGPSDVGLVLEKEDATEKVESPTPEVSTEELDFIIRHVSGKKLSEEELWKPNTMPGN
jgi:type IV secretory pathway VirB10-like protein